MVDPQYVDIVIRETASVENGRLKTDIRSSSSDTDAINRHDARRGSMLGTVTTLLRYRVSFPKHACGIFIG
jgi:hypothetical protein